MAASATITINGTVVGLALGGNRALGPLSMSSTNANGQVQEVVLASGANTITVPQSPAPTCVMIQLPLTNTFTVTLKGITGDTGIAIGKTGFAVIPFDTAAPVASFVLTSAGAQTGLITEIAFL